MSLSLESTKLEHASGPALPHSSGLGTGPALGKPPAQSPQARVESSRKGKKETDMGTGKEKDSQIARVQTESQEGSREGRTGEPGAYMRTDRRSSK